MPVPVQELCRVPSPMHQHPPGIDARPWSPLCLAFSTPSSVPSRHSVYAFIAALTGGRRLTGWAPDVPTGLSAPLGANVSC